MRRGDETSESTPFGPEPEGFSFRNLFRRPVRLGWAAGFSIVMGAAGFLLTLTIVRVNQVEEPVRATEVLVRIVERAPDRVENGAIVKKKF